MSETSDEKPDQTQGSGEIDQTDIDALFGGGAEADSPGAKGTPDQPDGGSVSQNDIDAILNSAEAAGAAVGAEAPPPSASEASPEPDTRLDSEGRPFDEAAAEMAAAIEEQKGTASTPSAAPPPSQPPPETSQLDLPELGEPAKASVDAHRVTMLNDVNLHVEIELGRTRMLVEDVLQLGEGSVVELDKLAGDPVDVFVNDRLIARGEVLVLNDSFCVRVSEVLTDDPHRISK